MEGPTSSQAKGGPGKSVSDDDPMVHSSVSGTGSSPSSSSTTISSTTTNSPTGPDDLVVPSSDSPSNGSFMHLNDELDASVVQSPQCLNVSVSVPVTVHFEEESTSLPQQLADSLLLSHEPTSTDAFSDSLMGASLNETTEPLNASSEQNMLLNASKVDTEEAVPSPRNDHSFLQEHADLIVQQIVFESVLKATQISGHSSPSVCMISSSLNSSPSTTTTSPSLEDASSPSSRLQSMPAADDDDVFNPKAVLFANTNQTSNSDSESGSQSESDTDCSLSVSTPNTNTTSTHYQTGAQVHCCCCAGRSSEWCCS